MIIENNKIVHAHSIAELMCRYYDKFNIKILKRSEMYVLGYMSVLGDLLQFDNKLINNKLVEYLQRSKTIPTADCDVPAEIVCLWWAINMVESCGEDAGKIVGFTQRLYSLKLRCGRDSTAYSDMVRMQNWLVKNMPENIPTGSLE